MNNKRINGIDNGMSESEKKRYLTRQLFIHTEDKEMVSITDRAVSFGIVFPVMVDYKLWVANSKKNDFEMRWLDEILKICTNFYHSGSLVSTLTFDFFKDKAYRQSIQCEIEHDKYNYPYLLITLNENVDDLRLH